MMATTMRIPTQTPALKIPPITSHELSSEMMKKKLPYKSAFRFIDPFL